jgi:hypothetical protein
MVRNPGTLTSLALVRFRGGMCDAGGGTFYPAFGSYFPFLFYVRFVLVAVGRFFAGLLLIPGFLLPRTAFLPASIFPLLTSYALEESIPVWALPLSLAATQGINDFFSSSGYLDVSVPRVPSPQTMCSSESTCPLRQVGFPIRTPPDLSLLSAPRGFSQIAASFVGS